MAAGKRPWGAGGTPDEETVRGLVGDGWTNQQMADHYQVDESTVRYWLRKYEIRRERPERIDHRAAGTIPWPLNTKAGHQNHLYTQLLRSRGRRDAGMPVSETLLKRLKELEEDLAAEDLVLDYSQTRGFMTRRRNPKIDDPDSIVRVPRKVHGS